MRARAETGVGFLCEREERGLGCMWEKKGGWVCAREKEKRGGLCKFGKRFTEKNFVNRFPFFCTKFSGQRK